MLTMLVRHKLTLLFFFSFIFAQPLDGCLERCKKSIREYNATMRVIEAKLAAAKAHIIALHEKLPDKKLGVFWDIDGTMLHGACYDYRAIIPVLKFYLWCRKQDYIVNIFITVRPIFQENITRTKEQLESAGFNGYTDLIFRPKSVLEAINDEAITRDIFLKRDQTEYNQLKDQKHGEWKARQRKETAHDRNLIVAVTLDDMIQNLGGDQEYLGLAVQIPEIPYLFSCVQQLLDAFWQETKLPAMQKHAID